ncbi:vacuolar import and degradation protein-domain-containing protein [Endogone sp. FLAS-F59071]|nr:vacuolar import and degradation protein-domain-containing protein [Endogone sp. FLAS-F59071]|eukprot:RUS16685.1 vacuolar import and degradation protein-domain-containing protein [Endogone sp. FLAS-F59071]
MPNVLNGPLAPHPHPHLHPLPLPHSRPRPVRHAAPHRARLLPPFVPSLPSPPHLPDQATLLRRISQRVPAPRYSALYPTLNVQPHQPLPGTLLNPSRSAVATSPSALEQQDPSTTDLHVPQMAPPIPIPRDSHNHPADGAADSHVRNPFSDPDRWDDDLSAYAYRLLAHEADDEEDDSASINMDLARLDEEELDSADEPDDDPLLLQTGPPDPPLTPFLHHIPTSEPFQDDMESDLELIRGLRQLRGPHRDLPLPIPLTIASRPLPRRFFFRDPTDALTRDRPHQPLRPPTRSPTGWHRLRRPGASSASGSVPPRRRKFQFDEEGAESGSDTERATEAATAMRGKEALVREDGAATWASSFLRPGRSFHGTQNLMNGAPPGVGTIHDIDYKDGTVVGVMEALNVPATSNTVVTYWEGEIVDFVNHHLWTNNWHADMETDLDHWKRFEPFKSVEDKRIIRGARSGNLPSDVRDDYVLMRWKEKYFVNISAMDAGLTIAGFYYICMRRCDGALEGYYYDPQSAPYQRLCLMPEPEGRGFGFAGYEFA